LPASGGVQQLITLALSPDESLLAATGLKGSVVVWDVPNQKRLHTLAVSGREIWGVLFSQDSRRLLSSGGNGTIVAWDMETGKRLYAWKAHSTWIRFMGMFPDGKHLCTASLGDNRIRVWEVTP
jgi:WD40 repeat protein